MRLPFFRLASDARPMPPELDDLAWRIAEEDSIAAHLEFAKRHPAYADEIARRVEAVRARREAGEEIVSHAPHLRLRRRPLPASAPLFVGLAAGAIGLALVVLRTPTPLPAPAIVAVENPAPSVAAEPAPAPLAPATPPVAAPAAAPASSPAIPRADRPTTLRLAGTPLLTALALVAEAGDLRLRTEGDVPNPDVAETLTDMSPRAMISTLAEKYGVGVREEAPGALVVSPLPESPSMAP